MTTQEELDRLHEKIYLLNNLLRKMEFNRLKVLYHFSYNGNYDKKKQDLQAIDNRIQKAIDIRIKLCCGVFDIMKTKNVEQGVLIDG